MVLPVAELMPAAIPPGWRLEPPEPEVPFEEVLLRSVRQVERELRVREVTLDNLLADAARGRQFTNQELLVMQVQMHKYALTVDLMSKLVQQTVQGLREVLKTQV